MRMLLIVAGVLMMTVPTFAWVDTFDYADTAAMLGSGNWSGNLISLVDHRLQVDGTAASEGNLLGHQTGPSTDWYFNIQSPGAIGTGLLYQRIGIENAAGNKHIWLFFDSNFHANKPITIDIDTGTWQLYYWQTWYGSEAISDYVTQLSGLWRIHCDASTGTTVYKDGQAVFTSGSYAFVDDPAMHFLVGTNYGGIPLVFNWIGTDLAPGSIEGTVTPSEYGNLASPDYSLVGIRVQYYQGDNVVFSGKTFLEANGHFTMSGIPAGTYDVAIKSYAHLQKIVPNVTVTMGYTTPIGAVTLLNGDNNGNNSVDSTDLAIVLANLDQAGQ